MNAATFHIEIAKDNTVTVTIDTEVSTNHLEDKIACIVPTQHKKMLQYPMLRVQYPTSFLQ